MPKVDPATYERAYAAAVAFVRSRTARRAWAESDLPEEIASDAMAASFDPARYPWKGDRPFDKHLVSVAAFLLANRARDGKRRADPKEKAAADENLKRSALPADAAVRAGDRAKRAEARDAYMLSRLKGTAREVYLLYKEDVFDVDQIVAILGKPRSAVYEARKRVVEVASEEEPEPASSPELASPDAGDDRDRGGDGEGDQGDGGSDDEAAS
jgi:DNA-directed RNA polymerase specialized sigma24 family protein